MKPFFRSRLGLIIIFMTICHITSFCTRKLHLQKASHEINDQGNANMPLETDSNRYSAIETQSRRRLHGLIKKTAEDTVIKTETPGEKILKTAKGYLGVPYCFGGVTARCLDCSGFVRIVFDEFGIDLPHSAQEQSKTGTFIKEKKDLEIGDLVFFHGSYKTNNYITHSAIYAGDNKFIHASTGKGVTITSLDDPWWKGKFSFGTRILQ